jgi:anti-sigma factor RsiW
MFNRLTSRHLDDAAFAELWTNAAAEAADVAPHAHLAACAECRVRFASFEAWMEALRADGRADADEAFPPERLKGQQAQILRRLEAAECPTRIIAFPKIPVGASRRTPLRGWVPAAAAAGLIAGIALGQVLDLRHIGETQGTPPERVVETARQVNPAVVPASLALNDEAVLEELEAASMPRYDALRAYDTFTPRAADFIPPR